MYNRHIIQQAYNIESEHLRKCLDDLGLDFSTTIEIKEETTKKSFFNKIAIPSLDNYIHRKTEGLLVTYSEMVEIEKNLTNKYRNIIKFIKNKLSKYIQKEINKEVQKVKSNLTSNDLYLMTIFNERYNSNNQGYNFLGLVNKEIIFNLDSYLKFYVEKDKFSDSIIIERISDIYNDKDSFNYNNYNKISLMKLLHKYTRNCNDNFIETIYNLQYNPEILRLLIKRNKQLSSFSYNPKLLIKLVKFDKRPYSKWNSSTYNRTLKLSKKQATQFAEFYIESDDKRLNCENIVTELYLNLKHHNQVELGEKLILEHYRAYSNVISGKFTKDSYCDSTKTFLRRILSNNTMNKFWKLVESDDRNSTKSTLKVSISS